MGEDKSQVQDLTGVNLDALKPLTVGIISSETTKEDLLFYRKELAQATTQLKGKIKIILFGYNGDPTDENWLEGVDYEFVKPTSINHYFKQLFALKIDLIFIPLIREKGHPATIFNITSENYNKYLEGGLFNIPILTASIYPYNKLIIDKQNGFIYKEPHEIVNYLEHLYMQRELVNVVGRAAGEDVRTRFNYTPENIGVLTDLFSEPKLSDE